MALSEVDDSHVALITIDHMIQFKFFNVAKGFFGKTISLQNSYKIFSPEKSGYHVVTKIGKRDQRQST